MEHSQLLRLIETGAPLFMSRYMYMGGCEPLARAAAELEPKIQDEFKTPANQAYAALRLAALLGREKPDPADDFFNAAWRKHIYDLVINDLAFKIKQKASGKNESLEGAFCPVPFEQLMIHEDFQYTVPCIESGRSLGRLEGFRDHVDLWLSPMAETLRKSVLDGSFAFCRKHTCGLGGRLRPWSEAEKRRVVDDCWRGPKTLIFYHDGSCNIYCGFCRDQVMQRSPADQARYVALFEKYFTPFQDRVECVQLRGSGEPFASPSFLHILEKVGDWPRLETLAISTNGLLVDFDLFDRLPGLDGRLDISVGVDSLIKETYEGIRRGGDFSRFHANIERLAAWRKRGRLKRLGFTFMALSSNYREIPHILEKAADWGVDSVELRMMTDTRGMSAEAIARECVWLPGNPHRQAFLQIRRDARCNGPHIHWVGE